MVAGIVFWMVLVLTPRAWVGDVQTQESEEVPVRLLDQPDDCLWCDSPAEPVRCDDADKRKPLWLNPDEPVPPADSAPCLDEETEKPSA